MIRVIVMLRIERCGTARIGVYVLDYVELSSMEYQVFSTRHLEATTGMFTFLRCCVCSVCFVCFSY